MARLLGIAAVGAGFLLYVWVAAVRNVRTIRAAKAARRATGS